MKMMSILILEISFLKKVSFLELYFYGKKIMMQTDPIQPHTGLTENEPYYLESGNEIKIFEAAYQTRLPVMLKGPAIWEIISITIHGLHTGL